MSEGAVANSERFLAAFRTIEDILSEDMSRRGRSRRRSFAQMVDMSQRPAVREFRGDLRDLRELRNALVHMATGDGRPIAEPHDEVVELIERIARLMAAPPAALDRAVRDVVTCSPNDVITDTLRRMHDRGVATVPVTNRGSVIGLLTAETVTRWLSEAFALGKSVEPQRVKHVLEHAARRDTPVTLPPETSAYDVLEVFRGGLEEGIPPRAVLITTNGQDDGQVLGVLTAADVPRLADLAAGH